MTRYDVAHPNGGVHVVDDAASPEAARLIVHATLAESALVPLEELVATESENQDPPAPEAEPLLKLERKE